MGHSDFLPASRPLLWDAKSCEDWLARTALSDPRQACREFTLLLEELEDAPPRHISYLDILERLRKPILSAQEELARKFSAKPLPLGHVETASFDCVHDLLQALLRSRRRLYRAALNGRHPELMNYLPLLTERVLENIGELLAVFWRARREADAELWQELNQTYATASARGYAGQSLPVKPSRTCTEAYLCTVLMELAHPYGLAEREFHWARRWAQGWAGKLRFTAHPATDGALCVDFSGNTGAVWSSTVQVAASHRYIDSSELARSIKARLKLIAEGASPVDLGLGADCTQPSCGELLMHLLHVWTEAPAPHKFPRRAAAGSANLTSGFAAIHFAVSGKPFASGRSERSSYSRRDAENIHIFQRLPSMVRMQGETERAVPLLEPWEIVDESASGFRLRRRGLGVRLQLRQLVALRPQGAKHFILAEVRWLMAGQDRSISIGVKAIPGIAYACAVRVKGESGQQTPYTQGFLLPVAPGLAPSLILPAGWYQNARELIMEVDGKTFNLNLFGLLSRGYDYDRANYSTTG
jgi:hypothetical protein